MKAQIVSFHCVLKNQLGQLLSSSFNHDVINQLEPGERASSGRELRGLIAGLQDVKPGEKRHFVVPAAEAYGPYDPALSLTVSRSELPAGVPVRVGSQFVGRALEGSGRHVFRVVAVRGNQVTLDGNPPLAGQDLVFDIEVTSARNAEAEDLQDPAGPGAGPLLH